MRCRACNSELSSGSYYRMVKLEDNTVIKVVEDLCVVCRSKVFEYSDPEDFDLIDGLGYDAE